MHIKLPFFSHTWALTSNRSYEDPGNFFYALVATVAFQGLLSTWKQEHHDQINTKLNTQLCTQLKPNSTGTSHFATKVQVLDAL